MERLKFDRHHELAEFLRNRRSRISPEQAGFPQGSRRRTPGLRRGEVAMLAGVSLEWYTYLEQGRDINVSVQVLEGLARALQLDSNERKHLFLLAHRQQPPEDIIPQAAISPNLRKFLNHLGTTPACVIDVRMNIVAWNKAFCAVFGNYELMSERERNLVWSTFTSSYFRELKGEQWMEHALHCLAQFRAGYGRYIEDPWWAEQISELNSVSQDFREMWLRHDVLNAPEGQKIIHHPALGKLAFEHISFMAVDSPDLQILINTPIETFETAEKIKQFLLQ